MGIELSEDDLEVAEASVKFAMENCPVEGLLSTDNGDPISNDQMERLLEKLQEIEKTPGSKVEEPEADILRSVIDYTSENCPVEGVAIFHDGRRISGSDIIALDEKLRIRRQA
jgi:hypothetical protein